MTSNSHYDTLIKQYNFQKKYKNVLFLHLRNCKNKLVMYIRNNKALHLKFNSYVVKYKNTYTSNTFFLNLMTVYRFSLLGSMKQQKIEYIKNIEELKETVKKFNIFYTEYRMISNIHNNTTTLIIDSM